MSRVSGRDARPLLFVISLLVILVDRLSKIWIGKHLSLGQAIVVIPHVFRITHVLNTGAAFSMFETAKNPEMVRYALIGDGSGELDRVFGDGTQRALTDWIPDHGHVVDPAQWRSMGRADQSRI